MIYGAPINDGHTTAYPTTEDVADQLAVRLSGVHPNARKRISKAPIYVSGGLQEYQIKQKGNHWYIWPYCGGQLRKSLQGLFTSYRQAEEALIEFLRTTDRWKNKAIWPGR